MKFNPTPLALALAAALGSLAALPASAAPLTLSIAAQAFSGGNSVSDTLGTAGASNNNGASLGEATAIQQFDASQGVLIGATLNVNTTALTQTTTVTVAAATTGGANSRSAAGTGSSTVTLAAPGVSQSFGSLTANKTCTAGNKVGCPGGVSDTQTIAPNTTGAAVAVGNLDAYVGAGTVLASRSASTLTAQQTSNTFDNLATTKSAVAWAGNLSAEYTYLLHASASFDGANQLSLNLDFGSFTEGSGTQQLAFKIFNAAGDRVGLDLDSFGLDSGPFSTNLAAFLLPLAAGSNNDFLADFDTSTVGNFSHSYTLSLSDADVGAESSRWGNSSLLGNYILTLNLSGEVTPRAVNGVPEPGMLALAGLGLLGLTLTRRRQRPG